MRDRYMGRPCADLDVVLGDESAHEVRALAVRLASALRAPHFTLSSEFGAERIVWQGGHLDLSPLRGRCIEEDLALRDFTVNAIALPLGGGSPCDPYGGIDDIARMRLVAVCDGTFRSDPVRLLRAVRFARTHGLAIDHSTAAMAGRDAHLLADAAGERLLAEVVATFQVGSASTAVALWDELGVLIHLFPEVAALRGVKCGTGDHDDVYRCTLKALDELDFMLEFPETYFSESVDELSERIRENVDGSMPRPAALRLAVLLHDIVGPSASGSTVGPSTFHPGRSKRPRFCEREGKGPAVAGAVCERLRCSAALTGLVGRVVAGYQWVGLLRDQEVVRTRDEVEFLWKASPWEPELIMASVARWAAGEEYEVTDCLESGYLTLAGRLMRRWSERRRNGVPPLPVRGDELSRLVGISPGPELGAMLKALRLEWEAGELKNQGEVMARAIIMCL